MNYKCKWVMSLLNKGIEPIIETVEEGDGPQWQECEKKWIAEFRLKGFRLSNTTDGGEGGPGSVRTPEQIERMRAGMLRWRASQTPEQRQESARKSHAKTTHEQRSAWAKKRWSDKTTEERVAMADKIRAKFTPERRRAFGAIGAASSRSKTTDQHRARAILALAKSTPEQRSEKSRKAMFKRAPELRKQMARKAAMVGRRLQWFTLSDEEKIAFGKKISEAKKSKAAQRIVENSQ